MYPMLIPFRSARMPHLGRLTTLLLLAVAAAGLTGCGDGAEPTAAPEATTPDLRFEPSALALAPGDTARTTVRVATGADLRGATFTLDGAPAGLTTRFEAAADGATGTLSLAASPKVSAIAWSLTVKGRKGDGTKTWVGNLTLNIARTTGRALFVDPGIGDDANRGTQGKPFKTLTKALASAGAGDTINLAGGGYGPTAASGETFGQNGLLVPAGVTIIGALEAGIAQVSTLQGATGNTGLVFQGDATVKNLNMIQFNIALRAEQGTQTLTNMLMGGNKFNIGVGGSAHTTLVGSTIVLLSGDIGVQAVVQGQFTMDGGIMRGVNANCIAGRGLNLNGASQATLRNGAQLQNMAGVVIGLRETAKATLDQSLIFNHELPAGCAPQPQVTMGESTSLTLKNSKLIGSSGSVNSVGIDASSLNGVRITLDHSNILQFTRKAVSLVSVGGSFVMDGGLIDVRNDAIGIDANKEMPLTIANAIVIGPGINGVAIRAGNLKLRNSVIESSGIGIKVLNQSKMDLGTASDPGNNTITGGNFIGVAFDSKGFDTGIIDAVGNTWTANTQGADASGHYTTRRTVSGGDPNSSGSNFLMFRLDQKIKL
jgi:hypothetical protein